MNTTAKKVIANLLAKNVFVMEIDKSILRFCHSDYDAYVSIKQNEIPATIPADLLEELVMSMQYATGLKVEVVETDRGYRRFVILRECVEELQPTPWTMDAFPCTYQQQPFSVDPKYRQPSWRDFLTTPPQPYPQQNGYNGYAQQNVQHPAFAFGEIKRFVVSIDTPEGIYDMSVTAGGLTYASQLTAWDVYKKWLEGVIFAMEFCISVNEGPTDVFVCASNQIPTRINYAPFKALGEQIARQCGFEVELTYSQGAWDTYALELEETDEHA